MAQWEIGLSNVSPLAILKSMLILLLTKEWLASIKILSD